MHGAGQSKFPPHQVETPYLYGPFCMQPLLCGNRKEQTQPVQQSWKKIPLKYHHTLQDWDFTKVEQEWPKVLRVHILLGKYRSILQENRPENGDLFWGWLDVTTTRSWHVSMFRCFSTVCIVVNRTWETEIHHHGGNLFLYWCEIHNLAFNPKKEAVTSIK